MSVEGSGRTPVPGLAQALRIGRPRQLYVGAKKRDYVPLDKRG